MDIERLKEHDLYVLRDVVSGLEEEQSIDPVIARQFEKVIDEAIANQPVAKSATGDIGETSDGYHTFNELYEHRTALFATLCNMRSDISWKSMKHYDGTMYDGMFIAGIETPEGQYTYHCDLEYLYMFAYTPEVDKAPAYDGHQPSDYPRLLGLSENSLYHLYGQSATSEEVESAIDWLETGDFEIIAGDEEYTANSSHHPNTSRFRKTAITALQAYQPTTRKDRTVEEVAISKTETTTDQPLCSECRLYQRFVLGDGVK